MCGQRRWAAAGRRTTATAGFFEMVRRTGRTCAAAGFLKMDFIGAAFITAPGFAVLLGVGRRATFIAGAQLFDELRR